MTAVHEPPELAWDDLSDGEPSDIQAERAVLGALLQSDAAVGEIAAILQPGDFYDHRHSDLYRIILNRYSEGMPAGDWLLVLQDATAAGLADKLPTKGAYLHDLIEACPSVANAGHYARIVHGKATARALVCAGQRISQLGWSRTTLDSDKVGQASAILASATAVAEQGDGPVPIGERLPSVLQRIEAGSVTGPSTGLTDLDALTYGLSAGLWTVGARPGMGKTNLLLDFARSIAMRQGLPAMLFTLEMTAEEIIMRILAAEARVPLHLLRTGGTAVRDQDWVRLAEAEARLSEAPLLIDDSTDVSALDVATRVRREHSRRPVAWVGVDYLQLLRALDGRRNDSREQEIAANTRTLKVLQGDLGINLTVAAQLNRGPEQRTDKRPLLSDLRESGSIEANANVVILLHRDDYYDKESPRAGEADLIVAKNRDGPTDTVTVAAQLHYSRFVDMAVA